MLDLFECKERAMTLTRASCARDWVAANRARPEPWRGYWRCQGCEIGARHAAQHAATPLPPVKGGYPRRRRPREARCCILCQRRSARLISRYRYCPTCYNRAHEVWRLANAKGQLPVERFRLLGIETGDRTSAALFVADMPRFLDAVAPLHPRAVVVARYLVRGGYGAVANP